MLPPIDPPVSASLPISMGGWRYNRDDRQDRRDWAWLNRQQLVEMARQHNLDFTDHPTMG